MLFRLIIATFVIKHDTRLNNISVDTIVIAGAV